MIIIYLADGIHAVGIADSFLSDGVIPRQLVKVPQCAGKKSACPVIQVARTQLAYFTCRRVRHQRIHKHCGVTFHLFHQKVHIITRIKRTGHSVQRIGHQRRHFFRLIQCNIQRMINPRTVFFYCLPARNKCKPNGSTQDQFTFHGILILIIIAVR